MIGKVRTSNSWKDACSAACMRTYESKKRANTGSEVLLGVSHGRRSDLVR